MTAKCCMNLLRVYIVNTLHPFFVNFFLLHPDCYTVYQKIFKCAPLVFGKISLQKFKFHCDRFINKFISLWQCSILYMIYKKCWYFKPPPKEMLLYITYQNKSDIRCNLILCKCWLLKLVIIVLLSYRTMTVNPRYVELWFLQCRLSDPVCLCACVRVRVRVCVNVWNKKEKQHTFFLT